MWEGRMRRGGEDVGGENEGEVGGTGVFSSTTVLLLVTEFAVNKSS
jgi:hypothetical protein